jgi:hypothetical protein
MSNDWDITSATQPSWSIMWATSIVGGVVAGVGIVVRLAAMLIVFVFPPMMTSYWLVIGPLQPLAVR